MLATTTVAALLKESRMQSIGATGLDRKSGGAQWRDLRFAYSLDLCSGASPPSPLSSRPEKSWAFGPPKVMKKAPVFRKRHPTLVTRPELRRSIVEGPAVRRSPHGMFFDRAQRSGGISVCMHSLGNVFRPERSVVERPAVLPPARTLSLKPDIFDSFAARQKLCPDTKPVHCRLKGGDRFARYW
jgi:hypothetical protein